MPGFHLNAGIPCVQLFLMCGYLSCADLSRVWTFLMVGYHSQVFDTFNSDITWGIASVSQRDDYYFTRVKSCPTQSSLKCYLYNSFSRLGIYSRAGFVSSEFLLELDLYSSSSHHHLFPKCPARGLALATCSVPGTETLSPLQACQTAIDQLLPGAKLIWL